MTNKLIQHLNTLKESIVRVYFYRGKNYLQGELVEIGLDYIILKCFSNDIIYKRIIPLNKIDWIDKDIYNKNNKELIVQELNNKLKKEVN